jgi:hypothetical protein
MTIAHAIEFTARAFADDLETLFHSLRVMLKSPDNLKIPAVLHDVIEDTKYTEDDIREIFGDRVALLVSRLSRREGEQYFDYIGRVRLDNDARVIKLMDLDDNLNREGGSNTLRRRYKRAVSILGGGA